MREDISKFGHFHQTPTARTINAPLMFLFGFTYAEFARSVGIFLLVCACPGFLTPFIAILLSALVLFVSRRWREKYPRSLLSHRLWNLGILNSQTNINPLACEKPFQKASALKGVPHVNLIP